MFIISCLFKKTCSWKKCPFRIKDLPCDSINFTETGCSKCKYPYDEQEELELEEHIARIRKAIDEL